MAADLGYTVVSAPVIFPNLGVVNMDMHDILTGSRPSAVFREYIRNNPGVMNGDIAIRFGEAFPHMDGEVYQVIWNWKSPMRDIGMSDEMLDLEVMRCLRAAGYI